jgi:ribonuclease E
MDEKPKSSWDDLIQQVGAAPAPDALERKRPAVTAKFDPPPISAPPAAAKPSDWNALASNLGVEATEPPPRAAAADKPERPGDMEASFAGIEPLESDFEEVVQAEISEIDFSEVDDSDLEESDLEDSDIVDADLEDSDLEDSDVEGESAAADFDDLDGPDALSGEAARSAFEALFQAGSFSSLPAPREADDSRRRPPRPAPRREPSAARAAEESSVDRTAAEDVLDEPRAAREGERSSEAGDEERPRRRRRRGRGRGRGRDRDDADRTTEAKDAAHADDADDDGRLSDARDDDEDAADGAGLPEEGEPSRDRPRRKRGGRRRRRGSGEGREGAADAARPAATNGRAPARAADDDDDDDEDDDGPLLQADDGEDDDDDEGSSAGGRRASHKNIPTWADAIGVMVETNLQSRKNSPQRPAGQRERTRGGRGRGRGRSGPRGKS